MSLLRSRAELRLGFVVALGILMGCVHKPLNESEGRTEPTAVPSVRSETTDAGTIEVRANGCRAVEIDLGNGTRITRFEGTSVDGGVCDPLRGLSGGKGIAPR